MKYIHYITTLILFTTGTLSAQIIPNFKVDSTIHCINNPVQFTDLSQGITEPINAWLWDFGDANTSTDQNPQHIFTSAGTYTITLTASNGTGSQIVSKPNYIKIRNLPEADFTYRDSSQFPFFMLFFNGMVTNNDGMNYTYDWSFPSHFYNDTTDSLFNIFASVGNHNVSFFVEAGLNCRDTVTKTIEVTDSLKVPNVFSPNGDGINDVFTFRTNGTTTYELTIFNRWGAELYKVTAKRIFWDGHTAAGVMMTPGEYYYVLVSLTDPPYEKAGVIVLR